MPIIPALRRQRQGNPEFEASKFEASLTKIKLKNDYFPPNLTALQSHLRFIDNIQDSGLYLEILIQRRCDRCLCMSNVN
jgi:hypothetical protein